VMPQRSLVLLHPLSDVPTEAMGTRMKKLNDVPER
jgi:hypothetical protein